MTLRTALILAAALFLGTLLVRLPARALVSWLPPEIGCDAPDGTLWHGSCARLRGSGLSFADVSWVLHPLPLLGLSISADLTSADPEAPGTAHVLVRRGGDISIRDLNATLPLPTGLGPPGTTAVLVLALPEVAIHGGYPSSVEGTVDVRQLHLAQPPADLGSYQLQLAPDTAQSDILGQLHDLDGPLAVNGRLQLQSNGSYEINGTVAPRATAGEDLTHALDTFLGPADAQGQHPFSLAGSL